jgi:hypothetical protein
VYKNVIAIGDSFMEGAEITFPLPDKDNVAGALLAKHYGCDFYNLAQSGVGILAIIEQLKLAKQGGILTEDSLIVYSIPPAGRIDLPTVDKVSYTIDYWFHMRILDGKFDLPVPDNLESQRSYQLAKALHTSCKDLDFMQLGEQIHYSGLCAFFKLLEQYNNCGIVGHPQYLIDSYYMNQTIELLKAQKKLLFIEEGFTGWTKANKYSIMPYGHPGADAHRALFELLI